MRQKDNWRLGLHNEDEVKIFGEQITILEIEYLRNEFVYIMATSSKQFIVRLNEIK